MLLCDPEMNRNDVNEVSKMVLCALFGAIVPRNNDIEVSDSFDIQPLTVRNIPIMASFEKITIKKEDGTYKITSSEIVDIGKVYITSNEIVQVAFA